MDKQAFLKGVSVNSTNRVIKFNSLQGWTEWSSYSDCSVTCRAGTERRTRQSNFEEGCSGATEETRTCEGPPCRCKYYQR